MTQCSCLCKSIKLKIVGGLTDVSFCHCSICRKATGSAFAAYGTTPKENVDWIIGRDVLQEYKLSQYITKFFCSNCGSTIITHHSEEPDNYHVSLGCLDENRDLNPLYHQYVDSKPSWSVISDSLKQYPGWPDDE